MELLLACLNFTLGWESCFCCYKWRKWFLWAMAAAQTAENYVGEWGLTWYLQWVMYTSIQNWFHSLNELAAAAGQKYQV